MKNKLIKNIIYYGLGDFLVTSISAFLLIPIYIKNLNPSEYGVLNILNNNILIFTYIFQFGVISAFSRLFFTYQKHKKSYLSSLLIFHILSSIFIFLSIFCFFDPVFQTLSPSVSNSYYLIYSLVIGFSTFLPSLYYSLLRVNQNAFKFFLYQVATAFSLLFFIFLFNFFFKLTLSNLLIATLLSNTIMFFVTGGSLIKKFIIPKTRLAFYYIAQTIKLSFPIFVEYMAYFFISRYSIIILQKYIPLNEMGLFTFALQVAMIPTLIAVVIGKAVQPILFSSIGDEELKEKSNYIDKAFKIIMIYIVFIAIFFVEDLFKIILPIKYLPAIRTIQFLLLANLIYNFTLVENSILLYKLKVNVILFITISVSVLNVVLNQLLVKDLKVTGAIISMLLSFSISLLLQIYFSRKYIKLNYDVKTLILCIILIAIFFIGFGGTNTDYIVQYEMIYKICSSILLTILLYFSLTKLIHNLRNA